MDDFRVGFFTVIILSLFSCINPLKAQEDSEVDSLLSSYLESDSLLLDELEYLLSDDSLSILDLLDSLIAYDPRVSQLTFRVGYTSQILNAGRDLGVNQYGFSLSASYYHKTGLFGELSGFWNSDFAPKYNPTILSAGYMNGFGKFSFITSYERYFYQNSDAEELYIPFENALSASTYLDFDWILPGINYYYLFGDESAHRIQGYISGRIRFQEVGILNQISILPSFSVLYGNQTLIYEQVNYRLLTQLLNRVRNRNITRNQLERAREFIVSQTEEDVYGIMNYTLALPIYVYIKNHSLMFNYSYNIPVELPGETLDVQNNSFISLSYLFSIPLK